jgi:hypothetical protein
MVNELYQRMNFGRLRVRFLGGTVSWADFNELMSFTKGQISGEFGFDSWVEQFLGQTLLISWPNSGLLEPSSSRNQRSSRTSSGECEFNSWDEYTIFFFTKHTSYPNLRWILFFYLSRAHMFDIMTTHCYFKKSTTILNIY